MERQQRQYEIKVSGTQALLQRFVEELADVSKVEQAPQMEGRRMTVMLTPNKRKS